MSDASNGPFELIEQRYEKYITDGMSETDSAIKVCTLLGNSIRSKGLTKVRDKAYRCVENRLIRYPNLPPMYDCMSPSLSLRGLVTRDPLCRRVQYVSSRRTPSSLAFLPPPRFTLIRRASTPMGSQKH